MDTPTAFATALRTLRRAKNMSQEDFTEVCTQAYLSQLENGHKSPTLGMIEDLAAKMGIQPLTLLMAAYEAKHPETPLAEQVEKSMAELAAARKKASNL